MKSYHDRLLEQARRPRMDRTTALEIPQKLAAKVDEVAEEIGLTFETTARVLIWLGTCSIDNAAPVSLADFVD